MRFLSFPATPSPILSRHSRLVIPSPALSRHFRPAAPSPPLPRYSRPAAPSFALHIRLSPICFCFVLLPWPLLFCRHRPFFALTFVSSCHIISRLAAPSFALHTRFSPICFCFVLLRRLSCSVATVLSPLLPLHRPAPPSAPAQVHQPFPDLTFTLFWYTSLVLSRSVDAALPYPVSSTRLISSLPPPIVSASTTPYSVTVVLPYSVLSAHLVSFSPCSARLRSALSYLRLVMPHSRFSLSYLPPRSAFISSRLHPAQSTVLSSLSPSFRPATPALSRHLS